MRRLPASARPAARRSLAVAAAGVLGLAALGCDEYLDVNENPNGPQTVSASLYLSPMLHWMVTGPQFDGRFVGRYTQQFTLPGTSLSTWDRMGYDAGSDNGGQIWRDVYWSMGQNLVDMMTIAEREQRWDLLGIGTLIKAWGWLQLTTLHGEIVVKEAIDQSKFFFNYDSQEFVYEETGRLLDSAIVLLQRTDGGVSQEFIARTDQIYGGDRTKWLKLAWSMKALYLNHFSNKASYNPTAVIAAANNGFAGNADDALMAYPATVNDDRNFLGRTRGNFQSYRQTRFVVDLMNGTHFGAVDPRMSRMLAPAPDGQYRGLDINVIGFGGLPANQQPNNFYGYAGTGGLQLPGRYLFDDKVRLPIMTYAELQFIKAEAALKAGDRATALQAYTNGVSSHIDWVNARNNENGQAATQITTAEKNAFLANPAVVPSAANLTFSHIMSQKYIALWAWGHNEIWMDLRRYNYTDLDPSGTRQVFPGFAPPTNLFPDNGGKVAHRIRPRFNSEYVWNLESLKLIGGDAADYHTKPLWITQP